MKPSEISNGGEIQAEEPSKWTLPYPASSAAEPAITHEEARLAETAICVFHNGLIRETGDRDGRVFFCPQGREYWRYTKKRDGLYAPLPYPDSHVI